MYGSLAHGVPEVVLPHGADNFVTGLLLACCGAGVTIASEDMTPETVREAVLLVLDEPSYRDTGRRFAAELPEPSEVARTLRARISRR
jgi:UDP:flavonoid glycosyltransferase YjiC (YdhE family)